MAASAASYAHTLFRSAIDSMYCAYFFGHRNKPGKDRILIALPTFFTPQQIVS